MASPIAFARLAGTKAVKRLGSAAVNSGLASVRARTHSQLSKNLAGNPQASRSHRSTWGIPRRRGNRMASGPSSSQMIRMASHASRDRKCEPAQRSEVDRLASMKSCTGPIETAINAGPWLESAANAVAKAAVRSRWSQIVWSGTRLSAGSIFQR